MDQLYLRIPGLLRERATFCWVEGEHRPAILPPIDMDSPTPSSARTMSARSPFLIGFAVLMCCEMTCSRNCVPITQEKEHHAQRQLKRTGSAEAIES
jgi:hypothetical protein